MEAGRELDALIAEKVMDDMLAGIRLDGSPMFDDIPHYSTQIADAWLVVEKLGKSFDVSRCRKFQEIEAWFWEASFHNGPDAQADTAPLAICLAALKAVEDK